MIFEGSEKKVEIVFEMNKSLLQLEDSFWQEVVGACDAQILSKVSNELCKSYLLSESSLFVWQDRLTMITCGQTLLINSILKLVDVFGKESISSLIFQRKNEYFPSWQKSDFYSDIKKINSLFGGEGKSYRFGLQDAHHLLLFNYQNLFNPPKADKTFEILMYDLGDEVKKVFLDPNLTKQSLYKQLKINSLFSGYSVDDYIFKPFGYSLNAVKQDSYYTIHVTPQDESPYISFETNEQGHNQWILDSVLELFQPKSFDIVEFYSQENPASVNVDQFNLRSEVSGKIDSGYLVNFKQLFSDAMVKSEPTILTFE